MNKNPTTLDNETKKMDNVQRRYENTLTANDNLMDVNG